MSNHYAVLYTWTYVFKHADRPLLITLERQCTITDISLCNESSHVVSKTAEDARQFINEFTRAAMHLKTTAWKGDWPPRPKSNKPVARTRPRTEESYECFKCRFWSVRLVRLIHSVWALVQDVHVLPALRWFWLPVVGTALSQVDYEGGSYPRAKG